MENRIEPPLTVDSVTGTDRTLLFSVGLDMNIALERLIEQFETSLQYVEDILNKQLRR